MRKLAQSKVDVLLRTLPMGVVIVDRHLNIVDCNSAFLTLFGIWNRIFQSLLLIKFPIYLERFVPFHSEFVGHFDTSSKGDSTAFTTKESF